MRIAYDGSDIQGWQRQPGMRTVQGLLEEALRQTGLPDRIQGSSRTDAGVHALAQVAHLDIKDEGVPLSKIRLSIDSALPSDVRLHSLVRAPPRFNARWSSRGKIYRYIIATPRDLEATTDDLFLQNRCWTLPDPRGFPETAGRPVHLDAPAMREALKTLLGTRDFAGLATTRHFEQSRKRTTRRLGAARVVEAPYSGPAGGGLLCITLAGDSFLKHMVRNLAGLLTQVGLGYLSPLEVAALVAARRRHEGPRAPGRGLTLVRVRYPMHVQPTWDDR